MAKYIYPAIFSTDKDGISVNFPDFESCYTSAIDIKQAFEMAQDVLCLTLYDMEENEVTIPKSSDIKSVKTNENDFASYVTCDTLEYRKFYENKAVKKTLTLPSWLNAMAEKENINFSQTLQNALKSQLGI